MHNWSRKKLTNDQIEERVKRIKYELTRVPRLTYLEIAESIRLSPEHLRVFMKKNNLNR